jgi:hypothetical protein
LRYTDEHVHFTGSLPLAFVETRARRTGRYRQLLSDLFTIFGELPETFRRTDLAAILGHFRRAHGLAGSAFFDLYEAVQRATHPANDDAESAVRRYYADAFTAIVADRRSEGVDGFSTFLSLGESLDRLETKLAAVDAASGRFPDLAVSARITVSRSSLTRPDVVRETLRAVQHAIRAGRSGFDHVVGFDISGPETAASWPDVLSILDEMVTIRDALRSRRLSVSVHLGEDLVNFTGDELICRFGDVVDARVDVIGHGVFLWIPEYRIRAINPALTDMRLARQLLLARAVDAGIAFEICPSTTFLTQPGVGAADLPTRRPWAKIPTHAFRVGTDSPALYGTTLAAELDYAGAYLGVSRARSVDG